MFLSIPLSWNPEVSESAYEMLTDWKHLVILNIWMQQACYNKHGLKEGGVMHGNGVMLCRSDMLLRFLFWLLETELMGRALTLG